MVILQVTMIEHEFCEKLKYECYSSCKEIAVTF